MSIRVGVRDFLRHCGHALTNTVHERFDALERRMDRLEPFITDAQTSLVQASIHIIENLHALAGRAVIETGDANGAGSAERALAAFLYSYVPNRAAIEIGELNLALSEADRSARHRHGTRRGRALGERPREFGRRERCARGCGGIHICSGSGSGVDDSRRNRNARDRRRCDFHAARVRRFRRGRSRGKSRKFRGTGSGSSRARLPLARRDLSLSGARRRQLFRQFSARRARSERLCVFLSRLPRVFRGAGVVRRDASAHLLQAPPD